MKKTPTLSFITLLLLAAFAAFGAMLPVAVSHNIADYFQISLSQEQGVMAWYLAGYALAQLFYGPLANWLGRRKALLIGAGLALIGSVLGLLSTNLKIFEFYLISRLLSGLGAGSGLIIGMILIKDLYEKNQARKIFSQIVLSFSFVPFLAIALGGLLEKYGSWENLNFILLAYAVLILILTLKIPETLQAHLSIQPSIYSLGRSYKKLLSTPAYLKFIIAFGLASSISYLFNSLAPLYLMNIYKLSAQTYGYLSIFPGMGLLIGGYFSQKLAHKISAQTMMKASIIFMLIATLGLSVSVYLNNIWGYLGNWGGFNNLTFFIFYLSAILLFIGQALMVSNSGMEALSHVQDHANGSSLMNALALASGSLMVAGVSPLFLLFNLSLPLTLLLIVLISLGLISRVQALKI